MRAVGLVGAAHAPEMRRSHSSWPRMHSFCVVCRLAVNKNFVLAVPPIGVSHATSSEPGDLLRLRVRVSPSEPF